VDWLIGHEVRQPTSTPTFLNRTSRPAYPTAGSGAPWQQACGIVQSWYSNERQNPPILRNICLQANANVVVIEPSETPTFDFWLRISTLEAGKPIRVPLTLYGRAKETIAEFPKLCTGVTLNRREGQWYATFVVERRGKKPQSKAVIGVDIGMVNMSLPQRVAAMGKLAPNCDGEFERSAAKRRRKQKLNACFETQRAATVDLADHRAEAFARNEIGQALNQMMSDLPPGRRWRSSD
jgi:hypothetical protein